MNLTTKNSTTKPNKKKTSCWAFFVPKKEEKKVKRRKRKLTTREIVEKAKEEKGLRDLANEALKWGIYSLAIEVRLQSSCVRNLRKRTNLSKNCDRLSVFPDKGGLFCDIVRILHYFCNDDATVHFSVVRYAEK